MPVRLNWGGIRNLLAGVTTAAHHNPCDGSVFDGRFPVRIVQNFGWAHSLAFSPDLAKRYRDTPVEWPFIVHAAEGTDAYAASEIARLDELGVLSPRTVLVHAIAARKEDLNTIATRGASIVWCPRSNLSTYGRTLSSKVLGCGIRVALGTDSAITSQGDLIDEIRTAAVDCGMSADAIYRMVTSDAAAILRLGRGEGSLHNGGVADIVAVADEGQSPAEAILHLKPEFVMVGGCLKLLSERMANSSLRAFAPDLQPIQVTSREKCLVDADVAYLYREAANTVGPGLRLAGRRINVEAGA